MPPVPSVLPERSPIGGFALCHAAGAVAALVLLLAADGARARAAADTAPLQLKPSERLAEQVPADVREQLPTFFFGQRTSGRPNLETVIEGDAMMRRGDTMIQADRLEYDQASDQAKAQGNVRINRAGDVYEGPALELKVDAFEGFFQSPRYQLLRAGAHGQASRADFIDDKRSVLHDATYTTCKRQPGPSWLPDWVLTATTMNLDTEQDVGEAKGGVLRFMDVPVLALPTFTFPLSDARKSGFLPPTVALDNLNGVELLVPYYWNIAPNRDATLYPSVMSKRGVMMGGEFRYMEPTYAGQLRLDYMPSDKLRDRDRWSYEAKHSGVIQTGVKGIGNLAFSLDANRVSDNDYWRDFPSTTTSLTERLRTTDANLRWSQGDFSAGLRALKYQTLQDVSAPITPPYDRLPQITGRYGRYDVGGFDFSVDADYTQFSADRSYTNQPNAKRGFLLGQISRPWVRPGWFFTPKLQLHAAKYEFDAPLASGATSATRTVPTFSIDSGLVFERDANFFGKAWRQTLEPRAFYVNTPYREQNSLPIYDTSATDFNFGTIYSENTFTGNDRISDSNVLTLGVDTRFLQPDTGAQVARFGVAQRLRFKDQRVFLPGGAVVDDRVSDFLAGASVNWDPLWSTDATVQYNPDTRRSERFTVSGKYSPGNYRVVSTAYRMQRATSGLPESEQVDVGWQWPLNDLWGDRGQDLGPGRGLGSGRWYSVGRLAYSLQDRQFVDSIMGLEYDGDCWIGRIVVERTQRSNAAANNKIMFQIEFVGLARLGSSPLKTLRDNIPRYQFLREQVTTSSRFGSYE
ncbi:LPS-assembly protein LptD [Pseudorhodoferax sp. LjRoot39]|uniref:LPS-assembly protein LptD n=1 Tax=Pseudorhodoferax sp. LjRoot39 TaxID=3342328 RepID=UPI003ECD4B8D